ncbi:hypothetical protein L6164_016494 [Bauhinia variegata]|uniref:Uncharacterized protein n=1 Tax=Bauhinia variegata TaxID=167791 RepID=A0ACB9NPX1_BAUVA|nr:hypothetical protein L6164_016494 [Bauhinia variegata]
MDAPQRAMEFLELGQYRWVPVQRTGSMEDTDLSQYTRVRMRRVSNWMLPIQRETDEVRVITESIETYENRPTPACPCCVQKLLQKAEIGNIEGQCCICLDDFQTDMDESVTTPCSHTFHKVCILKWLKENNACPLCRYTFPA